MLSDVWPNDVVLLDMGSDISLVQRVAGAQILSSRGFPLGVDALVRQSFRHELPQPIELEHAIDWTEEAVMPLAAHLPSGSRLILQGLGAALISDGLKANDTARRTMTIDEVETLFSRLVSVSQGRPASQETLPMNARFFAAILILREFMHHLQLTQVTLS